MSHHNCCHGYIEDHTTKFAAKGLQTMALKNKGKIPIPPAIAKKGNQAKAVKQGWNAVPHSIRWRFLPRGRTQPETLLHSLLDAS